MTEAGDPYREALGTCLACKLPLRTFGTRLVCDDCGAMLIELPDLESALVTAGISFDRLSDPVAEYGECVRFFRPGMAEPYDAASEGYEPMMPVLEVRRRFADGLDNLRAWLDREHPAIPELERLEIVEDEAGDAG